MSAIARYDASVAFLRNLDDDWAGLVAHVGPCLHDPKAARAPHRTVAAWYLWRMPRERGNVLK